MRVKTIFVIGVLGAVGVGGGVARGAIGYDAITGQTPVGWLNHGATEVAEDTTLSATSGLTVTGVTIRMWNNSFTSPVNANVRVSVYEAGVGGGVGLPGPVLTSATLHLTMVPSTVSTDSISDVFVDVPDATASSRALWVSYQITPIDQPAIYPNPAIVGAPTVGTTAPGLAYFISGAWTPSGGGGSTGLAIQIQTIPGPAGAMGVGAGLGALALRRRGRGA